MTTETTTQLSPAEAIAVSREYFTRTLIGYSGTIEDETETSLLLNDFRNRIAIAATADDSVTRIRVSTLRPDERVAKYVTFIRTVGAAGSEASEATAGA